jgi:hypothetical protein
MLRYLAGEAADKAVENLLAVVATLAALVLGCGYWCCFSGATPEPRRSVQQQMPEEEEEEEEVQPVALKSSNKKKKKKSQIVEEEEEEGTKVEEE